MFFYQQHNFVFIAAVEVNFFSLFYLNNRVRRTDR